MQDGEGDDDNIADWAHLYEAGAFEDEPMDDAEEMDEAGENAAEDQPPNELGKVLLDTYRDNETMKESVGGSHLRPECEAAGTRRGTMRSREDIEAMVSSAKWFRRRPSNTEVAIGLCLAQVRRVHGEGTRTKGHQAEEEQGTRLAKCQGRSPGRRHQAAKDLERD